MLGPQFWRSSAMLLMSLLCLPSLPVWALSRLAVVDTQQREETARSSAGVELPPNGAVLDLVEAYTGPLRALPPLVTCGDHKASKQSLVQFKALRQHSLHSWGDDDSVEESPPHSLPEATPNENLDRASASLCAMKAVHFVTLHVDPRFAENHRRLSGPDGWLDRAFATYVNIPRSEAGQKVALEADLLLQSVHHFSKIPIVVASYGTLVPASWTPERFPNMVLVHGKGDAMQNLGLTFNFNKLRTMLFTKIKTGVVLDADQWVNRGVDALFARAEEEGSAAHPYPIMPTHWMSRDPESDDYQHFLFQFGGLGSEVPKRTMRWGHAHPTWTHHSLPFLAKWIVRSAAASPWGRTSLRSIPDANDVPRWLQMQYKKGPVEDEDLLNMALWAENVTKQWCKFDITSPNDFDTYLHQRTSGPMEKFGADKKWFPRGIPLVFYSAHDAKSPLESKQWLDLLWEGAIAANNESAEHENLGRRTILYDGHWFSSGSALKEYDPNLRCLA